MIATFLGWTRKAKDNSFQPNYACETAFKAIEMIDDGYLREADLKGLKRSHVAEPTLGQNGWNLPIFDTNGIEERAPALAWGDGLL